MFLISLYEKRDTFLSINIIEIVLRNLSSTSEYTLLVYYKDTYVNIVYQKSTVRFIEASQTTSWAQCRFFNVLK